MIPESQPHSPREGDVWGGTMFSSSYLSLIAAGQRQQMFVAYFDQFHPSLSSTHTDGSAWMKYLLTIPCPSKALEKAGHAVSLARLGAATGCQQMQKENLELYTQALQSTQRALWDSKQVYSDEVLEACMFLAVYEVFECPNGTREAFLSHHNGCAKLIRMRGPSAFSDGFAHSIFQGFRLISSLEALQSKDTFLSDQGWRDIPFAKVPKVPLQSLLDLILDGPKILERVEILNATAKEKKAACTVDLIKDCIALDSKLQAFIWDLKASEGCVLYWTVPSSNYGVEGSEIFSLSHQFPNVRIATTMMLTWSVMALLPSGICNLYQDLVENTTLTLTPEDDLKVI
ncbi:hypothetical protein EJ08DRAFT_732035 [Tothia fuscella]|uniref:Uncharacterized protein n=1 Tax=Tothia fuscella TaxID=1048955 RepID=A0A9P4U0Z5_9PEZI|nr:hypothetical protein EJ08DRAFT_732035 [Tothia fuscella]